MSQLTITTEPDANGMLHVQVPSVMAKGKLRVVATPLAEDEQRSSPMTDAENAELAKTLAALRTRAGLQRRQLSAEELEGRRRVAFEALAELRESNPYMDLADPVSWQREIRADVVQPYRG
jgi:hypothetical protein